jgi:hypothetical protein
MKKIFFSLAFMLIGLFASANTNIKTTNNVVVILNKLNNNLVSSRIKSLAKDKWYKVTCSNGKVFYLQAVNLTNAEHMADLICGISLNNDKKQKL